MEGESEILEVARACLIEKHGVSAARDLVRMNTVYDVGSNAYVPGNWLDWSSVLCCRT